MGSSGAAFAASVQRLGCLAAGCPQAWNSSMDAVGSVGGQLMVTIISRAMADKAGWPILVEFDIYLTALSPDELRGPHATSSNGMRLLQSLIQGSGADKNNSKVIYLISRLILENPSASISKFSCTEFEQPISTSISPSRIGRSRHLGIHASASWKSLCLAVGPRTETQTFAQR
jgi:hypothetical protein